MKSPPNPVKLVMEAVCILKVGACQQFQSTFVCNIHSLRFAFPHVFSHFTLHNPHPTQGLKPAKVKDTNTGKFVNDYWETSKKMLSDMGFLDALRSYDKV